MFWPSSACKIGYWVFTPEALLLYHSSIPLTQEASDYDTVLTALVMIAMGQAVLIVPRDMRRARSGCRQPAVYHFTIFDKSPRTAWCKYQRMMVNIFSLCDSTSFMSKAPGFSREQQCSTHWFSRVTRNWLQPSSFAQCSPESTLRTDHPCGFLAQQGRREP